MTANKNYNYGLLPLLILTILFGCGDSDDERDDAKVVRNYSVLTAKTDNAAGATWHEGDSLAVYTVTSTSHFHYTLTDFPGTATAAFKLQQSSSTLTNDAKCFVLTAPHNIYSFSATNDGNALLTYQLPAEYAAEQLAPENGTFLLNIPSWGELAFDSNGHASTTLKPLTAFLTIDLSVVPDDTKFLLLTTHNRINLNGNNVVGGSGEVLSGNFNCLLQDGATLSAVDIFRNDDFVKIKLEEDTGWKALGRICIPMIVGNYERLQLYALTEESYLDYVWTGSQLYTIEGLQLKLNSIR